MNSLLWILWTLGSAFFFFTGFLIWLVTLPFDPTRKILHQHSCIWARYHLWVNPYWHFSVEGLEKADPKKTYVIVCNHQSLTDVMVVYQTFLHFKWISKHELLRVPFIGWNLWLNKHITIKRGDPESRQKCMAQAKAWLEKGVSLFFFPEGTRSKDGKLLPFKAGAFRLSMETGSDILPMVITGSQSAVPKHSAKLTSRADIKLKILEPISVGQFEDAAELMAKTKKVMELALSC